MNTRVLGYRYDDVSQSLVIDEEESNVVKCIFELYTTYSLKENEIENLVKGIKSLHDIIGNRINNILNKLYEKNESITEKIDVNDMIATLEENKDTVIDMLEQIKAYINESNRDLDKELLKEINGVILLIQDTEKINDKYGNFENISKIYKQYLTDKYGVKVKQQEAIISKELWEEVSKKVSMPKEDSEIDITE